MTEKEPLRARSIEDMGKILGALMAPDDIAASITAYRPRPSDIIISPFAKCGTTWLQQTFHCLRTRGDMDFDDISRVVPWIETAGVVGLDLEAPQRAEPRGFKSHLGYAQMPKGARYVIALRDPRDALVSMYRFMEGWVLEPGAASIEEFAQIWLAGGGKGPGYWEHLLGWWEERDNPAVLLLTYEHMRADPAANIRKLAAFCGIPLDDDLLALTLERSSLAYMLKHKDRFDDLLIRHAAAARCNLPIGGDAAKVRKGEVGGHRQELSGAIVEALDAIWARVVTPTSGHSDYADLEAALRKRNML